MHIAKDRVAHIEYTVQREDGSPLGNAQSSTTHYLHGHGNLVPGLEQALEGRSAGDQIDVLLEPQQAFGVRDAGLVFELPKSELPANVSVVRGAPLRITLKGKPRQGQITKVKLNSVEIDANHPWADLKVRFSVQVKQVRKAAKDELAHGHAHAPGQHH